MNLYSFNFRGRNSLDMGLAAVSHDFLFPEKRMRRLEIPFRSGTYDYGARYYNDRELRIRCVWISHVTKAFTRADMREAAYWLSTKGRLELSVEPDKYYIGEVYDANELIAHYNNTHDGPMATDGEFEITFICDPFAYKTVDTTDISTGVNGIKYEGTAGTPCLITLKNNNNYTVSGVQIALTRRRV